MRIRHQHWEPEARTELERLTSQFTMALLGPIITPPSVPIDTSEAAAQAIQPAARSIRETVYDYVASQGAWGATCGELCAALALNASTARPRLRELEGSAPWCRGQLLARIVKTSTKRGGMRVYQAL